MALIGTPLKQINFNDGEAVTEADLNGLQTLAHAAAGDYPNLDLVFGLRTGFLDASGTVNTPGKYEDQVFVRGLGLSVSANPTLSPFYSNLTPGFIGLIPGTGSAGPEYKTKSMLWGYAHGSGLGIGHSPAATGLQRWDLITAKATPVVNNSQVVTFKDATTGVISSSSKNKASTFELDISVTTGTEVASNPALPSIPANRALIAAVLVTDTTVTAWRDYCYPLGPVQSSGCHGSDMIFGASPTKTVIGQLVQSATDVGYAIPSFKWNPLARIIGVRIRYAATTGVTASLGNFRQYPLVGSSVLSFTQTDSIGLTTDGEVHDVIVDPAAPMWGSGRSWRDLATDSAMNERMVPCVRFTPNAGTYTVYSVDFLYVI